MKFEFAPVKKGDLVKVLTGREKGKTGKVLAVFPKKERVLVEKLNIVKRHTKPTQKHKQGGIFEKEAPINWSNVLVMCGKCNKSVRIKHKMIENKNSRVCSKCGEMLDTVK